MEFSTINESSLHKELKNLYCLKYNGKTEVSCEGHVYDILTKDNSAIEIQTKNLRQLLPKIDDALEKGHKVTVVHPVVITKTIKTYNLENKCISSKKSPKKGHIYDLFRELTGIFPVLLNRFSVKNSSENMPFMLVRSCAIIVSWRLLSSNMLL